MDPRLFCEEWCRILKAQTLTFIVPMQADGHEVRIVWQAGKLSLTTNGQPVSDEPTAMALFREMMR